MPDFVQAGYAHSCMPVAKQVLIHIGQDVYELTIPAVQHVLSGVSAEELYRRIPQTVFDECNVASPLQVWGTIALSRTRRSVVIRPRDGRLYLINAEALRDVMHRKIPRASVSEIVKTTPTTTKATAV